jgi:hypothetical protein
MSHAKFDVLIEFAMSPDHAAASEAKITTRKQHRNLVMRQGILLAMVHELSEQCTLKTVQAAICVGESFTPCNILACFGTLVSEIRGCICFVVSS